MTEFDPCSHPVVFAAASEQDLTVLKTMVVALVEEAQKDYDDELKRLGIDDVSGKETTKSSGGNIDHRKQELLRRGVPNPVDEAKTLDDDEFDDVENDEEMEEDFDEEDEEETVDAEGQDSAEMNRGKEEKKNDNANDLRLWQKNDAILVEAAHSAIRSNNLDALKVIVDSGAIITGQSLSTGGTVFHAAAEYDHEEILKYLLKNKAEGGAGLANFVNDPERFDLFSTPLHWAAIRGVTNCCEILIANGCHKNARNKDKYTALLLALAQAKEETFEKLLELGCDPNVRNEDGHTCLHLAIGEMENEKIANILIKSGKCDLAAKDVVNWTPLALAVTEGNTSIVELLLEAGSPISYGEEEEENVNNKTAENGHSDDDDYDDEEVDADLPLISVAAKNGHAKIVELLLKFRKEEIEADLHKKDRLGKTPLYWCSKGPKKSRDEITRMLYGVSTLKRGRED